MTVLQSGHFDARPRAVVFLSSGPQERRPRSALVPRGFAALRSRVLLNRLQTTRVKNAVRMRAFPASGANLPVPPPIEIIRDTKTN